MCQPELEFAVSCVALGMIKVILVSNFTDCNSSHFSHVLICQIVYMLNVLPATFYYLLIMFDVFRCI